MNEKLYLKLENFLKEVIDEHFDKQYLISEGFVNSGRMEKIIEFDRSINKQDLFLIREKNDYKSYIQGERENKLKDICDINHLDYDKLKHQSSHILRNKYMDNIIEYAETNGFYLALIKRDVIQRYLPKFSRVLSQTSDKKNILERFIDILEEAFTFFPDNFLDEINKNLEIIKLNKPLDIFSRIYDFEYEKFQPKFNEIEFFSVDTHESFLNGKRNINKFNDIRKLYTYFFDLIFEKNTFEIIAEQISKIYSNFIKERNTPTLKEFGLKYWDKELVKLITPEIKEKIFNLETEDLKFNTEFISLVKNVDKFLGKSIDSSMFLHNKTSNNFFGRAIGEWTMFISPYTGESIISTHVKKDNKILYECYSEEAYSICIEMSNILIKENQREKMEKELNSCIKLLNERLGYDLTWKEI